MEMRKYKKHGARYMVHGARQGEWQRAKRFFVHRVPCIVYLYIVFLGCNTIEKTEITGLRCEYRTNPLGIETPHPRFSWLITSGERSIYQQAYRIVVSDNPEEVKKKNGSHWDSGFVISGNTGHIAYEGVPLVSDHTYYWRICSQINGKEIWSKPAEFRTGMLNPSDWKAQWISTPEPITFESPLFRQSFSIDKTVKEAYVYAAAAGFYELYLNGEKVGGDVLNPSVTDYRQTVLYSVYELTKHLKKGVNVFGLMLGNGAYNMPKAPDRYCWDGNSFGNPRFLLQLNIKYLDGSEATVTSGEEWKYTGGPVTFNNLYGGEDYDARKEIEGWAAAGLDDSDWKKASLAEPPGGKPKYQDIPIQVTQTLLPIAKTQPRNGVYLFDLGQNIAGWWRITVKGLAGQSIRVRGSETLNNDLFPKNLEDDDKISDKFSYHSKTWTDYTLKNNEKAVYEPRFFYSGFRYIEVAVSDSIPLAQLEVEGRAVGSNLERTGNWSSSNDLLNRIYNASLWSQRGNLVGYPTDCPHREKGAYNGDGQVIAETSMHDFNMAPFYAKWLNDMRDAQEPNGRIPNTSPTIVGGMGGGIAWGSAYILIPWWMYHYCNDTRLMEEHYPNMKRYLEYLHQLATTDEKPEEPYIINDFDSYWYSLGEWCSPGRTDCPNHAVVNTFYYYYDAHLMSQIAELLGYKEDSGRFKALSDTVRDEFNRKFFNPETALYGSDSTYQTYQLLALAGNITPETHRILVLKTITDDIKERNNHLNTGIIGTKYLWQVLPEAGCNDLAYALATQETYPSYGYWIRNNCTTFLEKWDGADSHNHQMFGTITEYLYRYLAGIHSPASGKTSLAYKHIHLQPYMPDGLDEVEAKLNTLSGEIISQWKTHSGGYQYNVTIPANTTATVILPLEEFLQATITESGKTIWRNKVYSTGIAGVRNAEIVNDGINLSLESGTYHFQVVYDDNRTK
jgi:alpha-L-rhamnosidase